MIGVILCSGRATRLKEETRNKPKCMVDVCGKPVLERIANYLEKNGVQKIIVNLSFHPEKVMKYFGQRFLYLYEPVPTGEFATVSLIKSWFPNETIMVVNGDTLITKEKRGKKHNGITYYGGTEMKVYDNKFIDMGSPKGLEKARQYYAGN